ncbi:unnamed protein product [Trichogramma brassicae]|uniref:Suppressor of cytokine signaling 5 n=1 Tax=Trichogramma brassicae TaxID=86971 RepID=A0A6H5J1B0_9HYME|nr:unnamed protein product [Trichogramma brassicae]
MSDEEVIRRRLLIDGDGIGDDRRINALLKSFIKWVNNPEVDHNLHERMLPQLSQCEYAQKKSRIAAQMSQDELKNYEELADEIELEIKEAKLNIEKTKAELQEAKRVRKNRIEYDVLAKVIMEQPDRKETDLKLANLQKELSVLKREIIAKRVCDAESAEHAVQHNKRITRISKSEERLDNIRLDSDISNHNSRFETLYSQHRDGQEAKQCQSSNGNFLASEQEALKQFEAGNSNSGGSSTSSSSEDNSGNPALRRSSKTLSFGRRKGKQRSKDQTPGCSHVLSSKKKRSNWVLKFNCTKSKSSKSTDIPGAAAECVCTGYRRTDDHPMGAGVIFKSSRSAPQSPVLGPLPPSPVIDLSRFNPEEFSMEDCDAQARLQRAREMEEGVEPPPGFRPQSSCSKDSVNNNSNNNVCDNNNAIQQMHPNGITVDSLAALFQSHAGIQAAALSALSQIDCTLISNIERPIHTQVSARTIVDCFYDDTLVIMSMKFNKFMQTIVSCFEYRVLIKLMHSIQVDYVHCLVPDLKSITTCSFYWGKMDRYEAERLLDGKQEGTFLLRDSAQEEFLFSVSFRKYGRSLHARIEQWNHKFSFDSHDPGVYASNTVCGLIEHYKDPSCCMFFEPMLTIPLHRNFAFPLQHLCRAVISSRTTYDGINRLQLPKSLKTYLKEYHYKQRVRVRRLDIESDLQTTDNAKSMPYLPA